MENLNSHKPISDENLKDLERVKFCMDSPDINDWEQEFLESIQVRLYENRNLTDGQETKLEQIEDVVVNGRYRGDY